jgi:hypothetical protein
MRADIERLTESFNLIKAMNDSHPFIGDSELEIPSSAASKEYAINLLLLSGGQPLKIETDFDGFNYFETATFLGAGDRLFKSILSAMPYTDLDVLMKNWSRVKLFPVAKAFERFVVILASEEVDTSPYVDNYLVDFSFSTQFNLRMTHKMNVADFVTKIVPEDIFHGPWYQLYKMNQHFREVYAAIDAKAYIPAKTVKDIMWIFIYPNPNPDSHYHGKTIESVYYLKPFDRENIPINLTNYEISETTNFNIMYPLQSHIVRPTSDIDGDIANPIIFIDNEGNYYVTTEVVPNIVYEVGRVIIN